MCMCGQDLMLHNLLPEGKLRTLGGHDGALLPREDLTRRDAVLALWYYEGELKKRFGQLLARLEKGSFDTVENFKRVCMTIMAVRTRNPHRQPHRLAQAARAA